MVAMMIVTPTEPRVTRDYPEPPLYLLHDHIASNQRYATIILGERTLPN